MNATLTSCTVTEFSKLYYTQHVNVEHRKDYMIAVK